MSTELKEWPLWEVFVRSKQGLEHKHCGSLHAADAAQARALANRRIVEGGYRLGRLLENILSHRVSRETP